MAALATNSSKKVLPHVGQDVGKVKIIKFCNGALLGVMLSEDSSKFMSVKMPLSIAVYGNVVKDIENILSFVHFRFTIF